MSRLDPELEETERAAREAQRLEDTLLDAAHQISRIRGEWPLVVALGDSHQAGLGFVPADVRDRMGTAYREEKRELRVRGRGGVGRGLGVVLDDGGPNGATATPGNVGAWSLSAELALMLRGWIRRVVADHRADGGTVRGLAIVTGVLPAEPSDRQILDHLYDLMWTITRVGRARQLGSDLQHYADRLRDFLDGEHRRELPGACPWCGRRTLVLYQDAGVIRCEGPHRDVDGTVACECDNANCGCHDHDTRWTHTWLDSHASHQATSWDALSRRMATRRAPAAAPAPVNATISHLAAKYGRRP